MTNQELQKLRKFARYIKRRRPLGCPVAVRFVRPASIWNKEKRRWEGTLGDSWEGKDRYWIRIDPSQDYQSAIDTLQHEWAHLELFKEATEHGERWGIVKAELYRLWLEYEENKEV